jgi:hypothetical protein
MLWRPILMTGDSSPVMGVLEWTNFASMSTRWLPCDSVKSCRQWDRDNETDLRRMVSVIHYFVAFLKRE